MYTSANCCAAIHVGYERTVYTTLESQRFVTLCAIIYSPSSGGAQRPFTISYTTADDTAGMQNYSEVYQSNKSFFLLVAPEDYLSTTGILTFNIGDARKCHDVGIVDNVIYETEVEQFISNLAPLSGPPVTVDPPSVRVIISDDTDDCKCRIEL